MFCKRLAVFATIAYALIIVPSAVAIERVSVASDGGEANRDSNYPSISADGRFVAFASYASTLVPGNDGYRSHVFVHDRQTGITEIVSVDSSGNHGNGDSSHPAISADGRFVAFESGASNLVSGDTSGTYDIFVHDRQTSITERVSVASDGSQANNYSQNPSISADGRIVAFGSYASNLVPGDSNGVTDIFVHDRQTGVTERVSVASDGTQASRRSLFASAVSSDGRYVAFYSWAPNLVIDDTNNVYDTFVHDRVTGATERVSLSSNGEQANGDSGGLYIAISGDGRYVAFVVDEDTILVPGPPRDHIIYIRDRVGHTTEVAADSHSRDYYSPMGAEGLSISSDGRYVAWSYGGAFVYDRQRGTSIEVSLTADGIEGNQVDYGSAVGISLSGDGQYIAFASASSNFVPNDTYRAVDIFVTEKLPDGDGDGIPDVIDGCPTDPNKTLAGICGCGTADTDTDHDGTPDCHDGCPNDRYKTSSGVCGCGVVDTICGCGVPDTDSDGDGTPDCNDGCLTDPYKTIAGVCGCGTPDLDTDGDGTPDCLDGCPTDPNKTAPGVCACGVPDSAVDGDDVADCQEDPGVSIDNAATFTNTPQVTLFLNWPPGAASAKISNDGGFQGATQIAPAGQLPWNLASNDGEKYPKIVYVRFSGPGIDSTRTYTDDIILDQTPPQIVRASAVSKLSRQRKAVASARPPSVLLKLAARDDKSGLGELSVSTRPNKGAWIPYNTTVVIHGASSELYLRVRDRAGNVSKLKRIEVR